MKLGYVIFYVPDVQAAVAFYRTAFGLAVRFEHGSGQYAEMETGGTALAFAQEDFAATSVGRFRRQRCDDEPAACEVGLVAPDVAAAYARALDAGAAPVLPPTVKPWGQTVAYVRDLNGCLVELCSEMAA